VRVGIGYDSHRFTEGEGRRLILGGVEIPHPRGLVGHSDADAVAHALTDISDGLAVDAGHLAARSGCRLELDLELAPGATVEDLGFGEDYELLAATPDPLDFPVIGRCVEGEGVEIRVQGKPVDVAGWEHFGGRRARDLR